MKMGNGCCPFARNGLDSVIQKARPDAARRRGGGGGGGGQRQAYRSDEEAMNDGGDGNRSAAAAASAAEDNNKEEKFIKFGPMLLKEPAKVALLVSTVVDDVFYEIQNVLAKCGWQSGVAASEDEAEERYCKLWPHLIVIDGRKGKQKSAFSTDNMTKLPEEKRQCDLIDAGATKLLKYNPKTFVDELVWLEHVILPSQLRIRASAALFTALEHCDNAIEITDSDKIVQFVNSAYEQLTGCHKGEVLGTFSSDLRRKSLPKELPLNSPVNKDAPSSNDDSPLNATNLSSASQMMEAASSTTCWRSFSVPTSTNHLCAQYVHLKQSPIAFDVTKPFNGFYRRPPSLRQRTSAVDTPVTEILSLLKDVQRKCEHDDEIQKPIQKVVKILNSTELYSPLITRFKQEDKVASGLFGGLVMNGPMAPVQRSRKTSLSEAMRSDKSLRHSSGLLNRVAPDIRAILQLEETWQFDIFELERLTYRKPLVHLGMKIFQRWKVRDFLQCTDTCLRAWLELIEAHYHVDNAYHNSTHAADVLQATAYYLGTDKISNTIEHSDAVAALLASIIHDIDHPGKGSPFLINTKHPLALLYNDVSVLESHHAALAFQLTLSDPRVNIFSRLGRQDYTSLRKLVVDMVLATDMNKHFEHLAKFQTTILATDTNSESNVEMENNKDRLDPRKTVCRLLIKCADVSNPTRPWKLCKEWAYRICEEYFAQTAEERAKGLPLTMEVFDRDTCNVPMTQCSFIDMFVREMFKGWCNYCNIPHIITQIEENYLHWQEESKIWPNQKEDEFNKIKKYLATIQHEPIGRSQGSRMSIDVPMSLLDSSNYYVNHPPANDHTDLDQQQQPLQSFKCTDL